MTLSDLATTVCNRVNQADATSVSICKIFAQNRYAMIYDIRDWRDSLKNVDTSLTDTSTGLLTMPASIERVIAIRCDGLYFLFPVDSPQMIQLDSTIFERSSTPVAYEEFTDDSSIRKIRFLPIPNRTYPLKIVGKRPITTLGDTDSPILRNIDRAWAAFTQADMLERQRQYGKSQAKVQEASALLNEMISVETEQSGNMPRVIPWAESSSSPYGTPYDHLLPLG